MTRARDESGALRRGRERKAAARRRSHKVRPPSAGREDPGGFRFPLGVELVEGENYRQRQGYDVVYLKDDETPRYQYTIAVSTASVADVFRRLAVLLGREVRAVLEIPGQDESAHEVCDVWMGRLVPREKFMRAFEAHEKLFVHDGMVGFGAISADGLRELFIDDHKLIYYYTPNMEEADKALAELALAPRNRLRHFSELAHVHVSLSGKGRKRRGEAYWEVAEELKRSLGLEWEESKEYS